MHAGGRLPSSHWPMAPQHLNFRQATLPDLPAIVRMLADDSLGMQRETFELPLPVSYVDAFSAIERDPNNELVVAEESTGKIAAVLQMTFTPYLTYRGSWRATLEGVRVDRTSRAGGVGRDLLRWAIERARARGCRLVQLTSDKQRPDAIRFYLNLGFVASHEGMKLKLTE